jgi:isopentenyl phosphate kinase
MLTVASRPSRLWVEPLVEALKLGLLPVVYGDVTLDRRQGSAIASTETVFRALIPRLNRWGFRTTRVIWCGATAGILDERGETIPEIRAGRRGAIPASVGVADGWDVTGGMRHRLETAVSLAKAGVTSLIVDGGVPGLLRQALLGEEVAGTVVRA